MTSAVQKPALRLPNVELTDSEFKKCLEFMRYCRTLDALAGALSILAREMKDEAISLAELYDYLFNFEPPEKRGEIGPEDLARLMSRLAVRDNQDIARRVLNRALEELYTSDEEFGEMRYTVARGSRVVGVTREGLIELVSRLDMVRAIVCP